MTVETGGATTVAPQDSELIQLLTPEGERIEHPEYPFPDDADLKGMYRDMVLVRRIDTEAIALQRQGELGLWASLLGQEAAQVGSGRALSPNDMAFPSYREHGVAWCRGLDPVRLLELFRGVNGGAWDPEEHKFHLYTIVIGDQTLHATGYAMGIQRDTAEDEAVIVYFGDGATSQGDVSEAFAWASVYNAPVVFFCQNNQFAISAPQERQSRVPIYQRAQRLRLPRRPGRRQRRARLLRRDQAGAARRARGPGPHAHRGLHLPDGRAHHHRRPHQVPAGQRTRGLAAAGPDRARPVLPGPQRRGRRRLLRAGPGGGGRARPPSCARPACALPDPPPLALFDHVYAGANAILDAERAAVRGVPGGFEEEGAQR